MHPLLEEVHELLRRSTVEFAEARVEPLAKAIEVNGEYPRQLMGELGKQGLLAPMAPPEYGGGGLDFRGEVIIIEEVAKHSPTLATLMEVQGALIIDSLLSHGSREVRERFLEGLVKGDLIASFALTEPCCGSDAGAIETRAVKDGGEWVINGRKAWVTSGQYADLYLVFARTGSIEERHRAITAFLVPRGGCIEVNPMGVMGIRGGGTAEVSLRDCRVPDEYRVGEVNRGFYLAMEKLNLGRTCVGAIGLGIAERAFTEAYDYAQVRRIYGGTLAELGVIQGYLAQMYTQVEALRGLIYLTAYMRDKGLSEFTKYAQAAKYLGSSTAVNVTRTAIQVMGAVGLSTESPLEYLYRDAKATEVYEGSNEVILYSLFKMLRK
ncbi:acyl-CoA dehydrogenase family protein [Caldivirga maquilingensis]|uniref:Acyl-CoA dehydrogenase domain protein n=1 Tax=Caldivirga maquilingensis (strain ATCC 700844 / DSM 13496 / JCM 10307 / IC-167) TaxID=397948 RepID=A8MBK2_CALMQ|nr:acyl-CoA dehydrogenase family protein [Caldivirga maquilingensis]ABW02735.1 acyl-CoA dehydrogenase domain protein [Caldivirga maquilingensis IC-167]